METTTVPSPAAMSPRRPFDRRAWERAVLDSSVGRDQRMVALLLAHHADPFGELAPGGPQTPALLAHEIHVAAKNVRKVLIDLEAAGFIRRPGINAWQRQSVTRPITLTLPTAAASAATAVRSEPEHPGAAGE